VNQPRPESRIRFLEKQFNTLGANVEELAEDLKQDIKQLNDGMMASFKQIGEHFGLLEKENATKEDLAALETKVNARFDRLESTQAEQGHLLREHSKRFDKLEGTLQEILARLPKQE